MDETLQLHRMTFEAAKRETWTGKDGAVYLWRCLQTCSRGRVIIMTGLRPTTHHSEMAMIETMILAVRDEVCPDRHVQ
jgi:hypothetical protein